jgi:hypothetical protein
VVAALCLLLVAAGLVAVTTGAATSVRTHQEAVAAKPQQDVVLRNFRYHGLDSDEVGAWYGVGGKPRNPKPNGNRDAHFSVVLTTPRAARTLRSVSLTLLAVKPPGPPMWRTAPAKTPPIGVSLNGKRLNPNDETLAVPLSRSGKGVRLDLYVNDGGQFLPGQRFAAFVQTTAAGGKQKPHTTAPLTIPGRAATMTASFVGRDEDRMGNFVVPTSYDPVVGPDGLPDAHFSARLDTHGAWRIVKYVVLQHIDAQGRGIGKPGGYCRPEPHMEIAANGWTGICLLLLVDGRTVAMTPLMGEGPEGPDVDSKPPFPRCNRYGFPPKRRNPSDSCPIYVPLRPSKQPVRLDVYVDDPDPGLAVPGQRFRLTVYFSDYAFGEAYGPPGTASATVLIR